MATKVFHYQSDDFKTSFDLPAELLYKQEKQLRRIFMPEHEKITAITGRKNLDDLDNLCLTFYAAAKAGLLLNWKSETMPDPLVEDFESLDDVRTPLLCWVGTVFNEWYAGQKPDPKVPFWKRVSMLWANLRNSPTG